MIEQLKIFFKNHLESIFLLILALSISIISFIFFKDKLIELFISSNIKGSFIEVFGSLLGLLLTAYAILFGLIPSLEKDLLNSNTFNRINKRFVYTILTNLLLLILFIILAFTTNLYILSYLLPITIFFLIFSLGMIFLLTIYLYYLFKITRKDKIKKP